MTFAFCLDVACAQQLSDNPLSAAVRPIAPNFRTEIHRSVEAPEEPLWPKQIPDALDIQEQVVNRATDYKNRWVTKVREPSITVYSPDRNRTFRSAVVICPGGAYGGLAIDKEGHDTARFFASLGVTGVVLKYRLKDYGHPAPLEDVQRAIATIRLRSDELSLDKDRVGVMGYSAGGHLASTAGTHYRVLKLSGMSVSSRPDFMILIYPVISMEDSIAHLGSRRALLGKAPTKEVIAEYSNELQVSEHTPPTFLVHALDDKAVRFENSLRMYRALQGAEVEVEFAIYEKGGHGFGLVDKPLPVAEWPIRCQRWLERNGFLGDPPL